ncbi:ATP-dependent protease LonB [Clostridium sp. ATCC 25772]
MIMENSTIFIILTVHSIIIFSLIIYMFSSKSGIKNSSSNVNGKKEEAQKLEEMKSISLTMPLSEKSRPTDFNEIIGQQKGIRALKAAICGPNPQHVIIYGPPGIGKTAAARLVLEEAKKIENSPFGGYSKFVEIDATTIRFDERGIADPLIGSVHDPIYQGAGPLGAAGVPQPKMGAVSKAHGGILFIDEIGELHPIEMNKLLKVLEDRKVFLDSAYYNSEDNNMPQYIKDIFDNGFPADFRLIGATTRNPEEIPPAIRSRCVEIFFRALTPEEIEVIANNAMKKLELSLEEDAAKLVGLYSSNGRDAVNLIQLASGIAINENRSYVSVEDVEWVIENGHYSKRPIKKVKTVPMIGNVNGLAVYGANIGALMEIEATAMKVKSRMGKIKITGIVEEEEIKDNNKKIKRKSTVASSLENVITVIEKTFSLNVNEYDIHVNFPGGTPVDGPSAGVSIATAIYSAITGNKVNNKVAMTGEISIYGLVMPVGGVSSKIQAAIKAGATKIIIPKENWQESFSQIKGVDIIPVSHIKEVIRISIVNQDYETVDMNVQGDLDILTAKSI